ncbi:MAG: hypothetical protein WD042_05375 [Phycisphaeraceae bacterium]
MPGLSGLHQRPQFIARQRPPVVSPVGSHVQRLVSSHRGISGAPVIDHPAAELLDRLQIEIERLRRYAALAARPVFPQVGQVGHRRACRQVGPRCNPAARDNPLGSRCH